MFDQQGRSVAERLAELEEDDLKDSSADVVAGLLFEPGTWKDPFFQAMLPGLLLAAKLGRESEIARWYAGHPDAASRAKPATDAMFDVDGDTNAFTQELSAVDYWQGIQDTTAGGVRETIESVYGLDPDSEDFAESYTEAAVALGLATAAGAAAAVAAGQIGQKEMMGARLGYLFRQYQDGTRAEFVAENEAANALNFGYNQGMRRLAFDGENVSKQWVDRDDGKVRPSHVAVGGTVVGVFDNFLVGNEFAPYPRWHGLSMEERAGCRCRLRGVDSDTGVVTAEALELAELAE